MLGSLRGFEGGLFNELRRMERDMEYLFGGTSWPNSIRSTARGTYPPINIGANAEQVDVYLFAAGANPESLDISIQRNLLTVTGERALIKEDGANYYRQERYDGAFRRVITLPDDVDPDQVDASYRDGVLHIAVKRKGVTKPKKIEVK
ncbi:MAG: Hsp20/alpha crystallin family protein [Gammaproteobacteria bacterium]|nr:Hsp20/alpha crystallin family protein [Gammaproteobacteria bacterium]